MRQPQNIKRFFSLFWLVPLVALADTDPFVAAGNQALQNNQAEEALAQYKKAEETLPNHPDLAFNKGGALYAQQKYKEAATEFLAATSSKDNKLRAEAYQHYGDALFRQQDLNGAIQAYEQALTLNPEDTVARHNLEVALSKQKEQPQSQQSQDQNQDQKQEPQSQPQSQNAQSQPSSQQNQQQQNQQNQDNKNQQDQQQQQQQSGQENKDKQENKDQQNQQSGQENKDQQQQQEQQQQQAQKAQQNNEPPPNEPQDKLLDALRAKEKSFLHAKQKGKGVAQPNVSKDW